MTRAFSTSWCSSPKPPPIVAIAARMSSRSCFRSAFCGWKISHPHVLLSFCVQENQPPSCAPPFRQLESGVLAVNWPFQRPLRRACMTLSLASLHPLGAGQYPSYTPGGPAPSQSTCQDWVRRTGEGSPMPVHRPELDSTRVETRRTGFRLCWCGDNMTAAQRVLPHIRNRSWRGPPTRDRATLRYATRIIVSMETTETTRRRDLPGTAAAGRCA